MRYFVLILIAYTLQAGSCYTVQLMSRSASDKNREVLSKDSYDTSCKLMEIGNSLTVRCGCYEKLKDAKKVLPNYKKEYKKAYIAKTFKYRFDKQEVKKVEEKHKVVEPIVASQASMISEPKKKPIVPKEQKRDSNMLMDDLFSEDISIPEEENLGSKNDMAIETTKASIIPVAPIVTPVVIAPSLMDTMYEEEGEFLNESPKATKDIQKPVVHATPVVVPVVTQDSSLMGEMFSEDIAVENEESLVKSKKKKTKKKKKKSKKKKKKKKKKSKDFKYVKKHKSVYSYSRYLNKLKSKKGLGKFDYRYRFGAQLSYDLSYVDEADTSYYNNDWRRIRIFHQGSFFHKKLFYELEYSFTGANKYKDNFLGYQDKIKFINLDYRIKYGNIKVPFSLERYTSSKNITFMERALNDAYADSRKFGAELLLGKKFGKNRINFFTSMYANSIDEKKNDTVEQPGYSSRLTFAHKVKKNHIISVGGAFGTQDMKGESVKYNQTSESAWMNNKYVKVKVKNVDTVTKQNIEALYIYNKYSLQAEYSIIALDALKGKYSFDGYYLQGSYFLRGRGRRYKFNNSTLAKIKPDRKGAIELALRYSYLNLNDKDEQNGEQTDYSFGVNWYVNSEIRVFANYTIALPKGSPDYDGQLQILQTRVLFAF